MRRELSKAIREEFATQLQAALPRFRSAKGQGVGAGSHVYSWAIAPGLTFFIMLHLRTNTIEEYTIELAFSSDAKFPVEVVAALPEQFARRGVSYLASRSSCRFRLPDLWRTPEQRDEFWWEITPRHKTMEYAREFSMTGKMIQTPLEESLSRVVPSVSDAFDKIRQYGIPFFDGLAKCRGIDPRQLGCVER